jgi:hypothetical protein
MHELLNISRRTLLKKLAVGLPLLPLLDLAAPPALAAEAPLLAVNDAAAKAVNYVEDASQAGAASAGNNCESCALYLGATGSEQGPCSLFPGKQVKARGWCSSWAPQM